MPKALRPTSGTSGGRPVRGGRSVAGAAPIQKRVGTRCRPEKANASQNGIAMRNLRPEGSLTVSRGRRQASSGGAQAGANPTRRRAARSRFSHVVPATIGL